MDETNYSGALIFWIYILAALFFSYKVIQSIIYIKPKKDEIQKTKGSDSGFIWLFGILAGVSFATLSYNMLTVLAHSFQAWSLSHGTAANLSPAQIWHWSTTSTLFRDFAEAIVGDPIRYFFAQSALLATLWLCMFMGTEGSHRQIPHLWAFFGLSQILPISFAQNLFYVALLRQPSGRKSAVIPQNYLLGVVAVYCGCLLVAAQAAQSAGGAWFTTTIMVARLFLLSPLFIVEVFNSPGPQIPGRLSGQRVDGRQALRIVTAAAMICTTIQLHVLGQRKAEYTDLYNGLFSHPAVTTLGCDLVLTVVGYGFWTLRTSLTTQDRIKSS